MLNGTNPLVPDNNEVGIPGLAPYTLFQPSRYSKKPEVAERLLDIDLGGGKIQIKPVFYNDNPVRYDDGKNCVETCDAIRKLAPSPAPPAKELDREPATRRADPSGAKSPKCSTEIPGTMVQ